ICFRIFRKINDYANRSNICAMFKKIHHKSLFLTI
ncbi:MAG: type IV secretion system protein VirD4, partial [Ruminiclostridium sp.]|nr:type IV secretion system protein VirD4 [Ruminiclostridium sp.]